MSIDQDIPLVSISCITYNQEKYISDAIEGFLMQKTNFKYEILIHDDASTDNTAKIIREYEEKYPGIFKPIYQVENQWLKGRKGSAVHNFPRARAKYIALCEGDDFWTDPYKLQKQVDFLENNPAYSMCFHNAKVIFENATSPSFYFNNADQKDTLNFDDLTQGWQIATASMVFRRDLLMIPDWYYTVHNTDIALQFLLVDGGPFKYIDNTMSVYRRHDQGVSHTSNMSQINNVHNLLKLAQIVDEHYQYKYEESINKFKLYLSHLLKRAEIKDNFPFIYKSRNYIKHLLLSAGNKL